MEKTIDEIRKERYWKAQITAGLIAAALTWIAGPIGGVGAFALMSFGIDLLAPSKKPERVEMSDKDCGECFGQVPRGLCLACMGNDSKWPIHETGSRKTDHRRNSPPLRPLPDRGNKI
jgi:hypothetical protein